MGMTLSQVINTAPIPVKSVGMTNVLVIKTDVERTAKLAAATEETIYENSGTIIIDYIEFATENKTSVLLRIYSWVDGAWSGISNISYNGSGRVGNAPTNLVTNGSSLFKILSYDETASRFKFATAFPLNFPAGVKITLQNTSSTTAYSAGCMVVGRVL